MLKTLESYVIFASAYRGNFPIAFVVSVSDAFKREGNSTVALITPSVFSNRAANAFRQAGQRLPERRIEASLTLGCAEIVDFCLSLKNCSAARSRSFGAEDVLLAGPGTSIEKTGGGVLPESIF